MYVAQELEQILYGVLSAILYVRVNIPSHEKDNWSEPIIPPFWPPLYPVRSRLANYCIAGSLSDMNYTMNTP